MTDLAQLIASAGYCKACATMRRVAPCHKCGADLIEPHPAWEEPAIPDVEPIRRLAREVGYAIGVHGSQERDLDLIAAPWTEEAVSAEELADHIARGINGRVLYPSPKPLGRWACNIQIDGWFKLIDLSVSPGGVHSTDTPTKAMLAAIEQHRALTSADDIDSIDPTGACIACAGSGLIALGNGQYDECSCALQAQQETSEDE